jgi:hypothetical protein
VSARPHDLEALLREALTPVEPPADLALRLEQALAGITELAHDELEAWEIRTMRDPRNWVRPVAAAAVGVTAGSALVALRVRRSHRRRRAVSRGALDLAERTLRDVRREARRVFS